MSSETTAAAILLTAVGICLSAAVDLPHLGRWKLNPARSDFGGFTLAFAQAAPGTLRSSVNGGPFSTCNVDGPDAPIHSGYTGSCRQLDARTWSSTTKLNGTVISTQEIQLSRDDHTLIVTMNDTRADGRTSRNRLTYTRTSGTKGLVGTWRAAAVSDSEQVIEFVRNGDVVTLIVRATNARCEARLDGKDYPLTGPTMPAGATVSLAQTAPRELLLIQKQNGRVIYKSTSTVSMDGQTLTESVLEIEGTAKKATKVYERQ